MKNLLLLIFIAVSFAACNSDPAKDSQRDIQLLPDAGAYTNNILTDTNSVAEAAPVREKVNEKPPVKTIVRTIVIERPAPQTGNVRKAVKRDDPVQDTEAQEPVSTSPATTPSTQNTGGSNDSSTSPSETASAKNDEEVQKKGMSKAAQGAIIGGVAGAVGGAVISKKKGLGAVVGGIAGAAGGYIIGKKMDKKDNRFMIE
jgi:hypothetical protein